MIVALLDINVPVALAWPNHVHHHAAHAWFPARSARGWATCSIIEPGFVRVSSNAHAVPAAVSPQEAASPLRGITALTGHQFRADDIPFAEASEVARPRVIGHQQLTNAHLVALAVRRGGCLATLDRGLRILVAAGHSADSAVEVVPAVC